jgi:hypothetical protein
MADRPPRLLKFLSAEVVPSSEARCRARVKLLHQSGASHVGEAEGSCEEPARLRLAAQAAAECVRQAIGGQGDKLEVTGAVTTEAFGKRTVFVQITAIYLGQRRELLGFCVISPDPVRAAALAVLNAVNRFLGIG